MSKEYKNIPLLTTKIDYDRLGDVISSNGTKDTYYCVMGKVIRSSDETVREWASRALCVDINNVCGLVSGLHITNDEEGNNVVNGDIRICGPKGHYLDEVLQGPNPNYRFFMRGTAYLKQCEDPEKTEKELFNIISFDLIESD